MAEIIVLPKIGVNMVEAALLEWAVSVGDTVAQGDILASVETDKETQDIYSPRAGVVLARLVEPGKTIPCQTPVAVIGESGENIDLLLSAGSKQESLEQTESKKNEAVDVSESGIQPGKSDSFPTDRIRISPLAKKMARESGINIKSLSPKNQGERITKKDVDRFLAGRALPRVQGPGLIRQEEQRIPLTGIRRTIAARMSLSNQTVPRAVLSLRVDASEMLKWKEAAKLRGSKIGVTEIIVKALGKALTEYPMLNARIEGEALVLSPAVNIGVAVDSERGLLVPVIKDAAGKGIVQIAEELRVLAARGRAGLLTSDDMTGGTFTVTNLGMLGIEQFTPLVNPPECAILAVGAIVRELVVDQMDDSTSIRPLFWLSLAFDHRVVDGAPAGRFLKALKELLEWPLALIH